MEDGDGGLPVFLLLAHQPKHIYTKDIMTNDHMTI
jgi:hypothetical protein